MRTIVIEISKCEDCKYRNCIRRQLCGGIPSNCPVILEAEDEKKAIEEIEECARNAT